MYLTIVHFAPAALRRSLVLISLLKTISVQGGRRTVHIRSYTKTRHRHTDKVISGLLSDLFADGNENTVNSLRSAMLGRKLWYLDRIFSSWKQEIKTRNGPKMSVRPEIFLTQIRLVVQPKMLLNIYLWTIDAVYHPIRLNIDFPIECSCETMMAGCIISPKSIPQYARNKLTIPLLYKNPLHIKRFWKDEVFFKRTEICSANPSLFKNSSRGFGRKKLALEACKVPVREKPVLRFF